ncbi:hypothetical protein EJ05DRAFT_333368 [Pseudovirgaria hyperparasitica]|uniref:Uncharacterized protein n=1 Tax=Pseudovirgaria hyperparasitica TaxID=470096 RepID=A0A6A6WC19_9PEZI|nr:uncharacterized protein EJ05DRAFT_333368 [Pseudovirgaria hyperparasitica]KAF2759117.1 hypothetical protein EJ05DRAFT_333368 [Pseudovirgaria hyperparasitica]
MPSFVNHTRGYTWPPSVHLLDSSDVATHLESVAEELPDINEDPFAHFISPVTEEDDPYDEEYDFNAGITVVEQPPNKVKSQKFRTTVAKKWAQYVALHHTHIHRIYHGPTLSQIATIDELLQEPPELTDDEAVPYKVEVRAPREPTRGRAQDLLLPRPRFSRGRRYSRTSSGRRHSWREPSPDLFTVMEESEGQSMRETDDGASRRSERNVTVVEKSRL